MKDLKNLKGAKMLSKNEQRSIKGGLLKFIDCNSDSDCPANYCCQYLTSERNICVLGTGCQL